MLLGARVLTVEEVNINREVGECKEELRGIGLKLELSV